MERALERVDVRVGLVAPGMNGSDAAPRNGEHLVVLHRLACMDGCGRLVHHAVEGALRILEQLGAGEPDPAEPLGMPVARRLRERDTLLERSPCSFELVRLAQRFAETDGRAVGGQGRRERAQAHGRAGSRRRRCPVAPWPPAPRLRADRQREPRCAHRASQAPIRTGRPARGGSRRSRRGRPRRAWLPSTPRSARGVPLAGAWGSRRTRRRG